MHMNKLINLALATAAFTVTVSCYMSTSMDATIERDVDAALLCVDITETTVDEAIALGAGIIIAHHPVVFNPLKRITGSSYVERVVERAIRQDIALYAAHTNLDAAHVG